MTTQKPGARSPTDSTPDPAHTRRRARRLFGACLAVGFAATLALPGTSRAVDDGVTEPSPSEAPKRRANFARPGVYFAFMAGAAFDTFDPPGGSAADQSPSAILGGKIGSRQNRWLATETSVDYALSGFDIDGAAIGQPGATAEIRPLYVSGNVKLFALDGRIQPWVAGGVGGAWAFIDSSSFDQTLGSFLGRVGGGVDVHLNEHFAIGPELYWNATTGDLEYLRTFSVGVNLFARF